MDPWAALEDEYEWSLSDTDSAYYNSDDEKGNPTS